MQTNFLALFVAAISTLAVGFIWYNPKVFGTIWMREAGISEEKMKSMPNMFLIFGLSVVYAFMISMVLQFLVVHQTGAMSATVNIQGVDPSVAENYFKYYGATYRTFKHGVFHGLITGLFLAFPLTATNALYERRSFKYVMVTSGFWIVCFMLMGGIICAWI